MTTVKLDIDKLTAAISALTGLVNSLNSQRQRAITQTPVALPSLGDSQLGRIATWLHDQEKELTTRKDLAVLLDGTGGDGTASYEISADTLANVQVLLGTTLANSIGDLNYDDDAEKFLALNEILSHQVGDTAVMAAMYDQLGPAGTVKALNSIEAVMSYGAGPDDAEAITALAENLRKGLATASEDAGFDGTTFGRELVRHLVVPMLTTEEQEQASEDGYLGMNGASLLAFMLTDVDYSDELLSSAADTLDGFEQQGGADYWYSHNGHSPLSPSNDLWYADPMAAMMSSLGRNPDVGMEFFSTEERRKFYFDERTWEADGYEGISQAADGISTDLDNLGKDPELASMIAASFVDYVANSEGFNPDDAKAASPSVAHLLSFYMPSVAHTLDGAAPDGDPEVLRDVSFIGIGKFDFLPEFYRGDLAAMTKVALSTSEGMDGMAEGVGGFSGASINGVAHDLNADRRNPDVRTQLQNVLENDAELRGFMERMVGETEIDDAKSRDAQRQVWIDLVSEAVDLAPVPGARAAGEALGEWATKGVGYAWNSGTELAQGTAEDHFASDTGEATDDASARAEEGLRQTKIEAYRSLINAGIVPTEDVPPAWFDHGRLLRYDEIAASDSSSSYLAQADAEMSKYITDESLETVYKSTFQDYYNNPEG